MSEWRPPPAVAQDYPQKRSMSATDTPRPAPMRPCGECPWRASNMGRRVPGEYAEAYTRDQRATLWAELRHGYQELCHMGAGDPDEFPHGSDPAWTDAGFAAIPAHAQPRECAGAVAAARRELDLLAEHGSWAAYHRARPGGLTEAAARQWQTRQGGGEVAGHAALRAVEVDDAEIIDPATDDDLSPAELAHPRHLQGIAETAATVLRSLTSGGVRMTSPFGPTVMA